jgi:3-hydroxybutyryl-CoA dehydrogenase
VSEPPVYTIGVIGAGTMGAGIAQLAAQSGAGTLLYDAVAEGLVKGVERIESGLARQVERGRLTTEESALIRSRVSAVDTLEQLAPCDIVIEAAPEQLELKLELFNALAAVVSEQCVIATNTSSLSVTEIAAGVPIPERVVGLHFFNPAPVMKLVEVVAGAVSAESALALARAVGVAMGKTVIDAADVAGFLVNRVNRPYSLTALRLLQEQVAALETIDRIARLQGGFRMGPFELMDLIGLETNHAVAVAFQRQSFGEPRYQPSPLQARMVAAGRLGRKTGAGWYDYNVDTRGSDYRPADPELPPLGGGGGRTVVITGGLPVVEELRVAVRAAGFEVGDGAVDDDAAWLVLTCDNGTMPVAGPRARLLWNSSLHVADPEAAGFHVLGPFEHAKLVEVTSTPLTNPLALERLEQLIAALGRHAEPVADAPGLVLGRIVTALINEAAFLIGEGNGSPQDVDAGLTLGLNHPRGPVAWSHAIGLEHTVGLLDALHRELGEDRYRVAPLLRRRLALGEAGL